MSNNLQTITSPNNTSIRQDTLARIVFGFDFPHITLEDSDVDDSGEWYWFYKNNSHEFYYKDDSYVLECSLYIEQSREIDIDNVKLFHEGDSIPLNTQQQLFIEKELKRHIQW